MTTRSDESSITGQLERETPLVPVATEEAIADAAPAAGEPVVDPRNVDVDALVQRIRSLVRSPEKAQAVEPSNNTFAPQETLSANTFLPREPGSIAEAGLTHSSVEALTLKYLLARGDATGREVAEQIRLPFVLIDELLRGIKSEQLVAHHGSAPMNDFRYQLTDSGRERARQHWNHCSYYGAAPVSLDDYIASIGAQSLTSQRTTIERLSHAFAGLLLNDKMLDRLGPAINSGRGLFLYGAPGNGKTSIAERITRAFGEEIWIPRAIGIDGDIVRVYDPIGHEEIPLQACNGLYDNRKIDRRWIRIRRPTIVVGGELTLSQLEVTINMSTGICEAPLQMKSNCGTLLIDDFGRQRVKIEELLNRWILPLERRYDFLNMPNGKRFQVPFDQLVVFSTNLEPSNLVDEAFMRRIPYKIEVVDPSEREFQELFRVTAPTLGFEYCEAPVVRLIERHYKQANRPFRFCHARDLLQQIRSFCMYKERPLEITDEYLDMAVENYFAI